MFASLFKRAEASVDNAIADLGNRVMITVPFLVAFGFGAASLSAYANRTYGTEIGNLIVAAVFLAIGCVVAIVVKARSRPAPALEQPDTAESEHDATSTKSMFDNEQLLGLASTVVPILLPSLMRTATKNWPLILAVAGGLFVFSQSEDAKDAPPLQPQPPLS